MKCVSCEKDFQQNSGRGRPRKFCSQECLARFYTKYRPPHRAVKPKICIPCGKEYVSRNGKYCSRKCMAVGFLDPQKNATCLVCKKEYRKWRKSRNHFYCSTTCFGVHLRGGDGQKHLQKKLKHKQTTLHRHMMEKHLGYELPRDVFVHHINHDKFDNRIENFELVQGDEHTRYHMLELHGRRREKITSALEASANSPLPDQCDTSSKGPSPDQQ